MSSSTWSGRVLAAAVVLAGMQARAVESSGTKPPAHKISPYARYAQEHAKSTPLKSGRVKVKSTSSARGGHAHGRR